MDYSIEFEYTKGKWRKIASFESAVDRDDCLENMIKKWDDCNFRSRNRGT